MAEGKPVYTKQQLALSKPSQTRQHDKQNEQTLKQSTEVKD